MGRKSFQNRLATRVSKADKAIDQGFRKVTKRLKSFQNRLATRVSKAGKAINRELEAGHHRNSRTKALREKPSLRQHSPALRGVPENGTNARRAQPAARNSPQPVVTRPRQPVKTSTLPKITPVEILVNSRTVSSRAAGRKRIRELEERLRALKNEKLANRKRNRGRAYPQIDHVRQLLLLKLKEELVTTQKEIVRNYNDFQRLKKLAIEDRVTEQKPLVKKSGRLTRKITRLCERIQDLQAET